MGSSESKAPRASAGDIIILLIGPTGAGKSTFIKVAAPSKAKHIKIGRDLNSCTSKVQPVEASELRASSSRIILVDTPALNSGSSKIEEVLIATHLQKWMSAAKGANLKIAGLLYFHRITDQRLNERFDTHYNTLKKMLSDDDSCRALLVTTMWDGVQPPGFVMQLEHRETELRQCWRGIGPSDSVVRFRQSQDSAREVVRSLLAMK